MPWWDIYTRLSKTILRNICWWTCYWHSWYTIWAAHHFFKTLVKKFDFTSAKKKMLEKFFEYFTCKIRAYLFEGDHVSLLNWVILTHLIYWLWWWHIFLRFLIMYLSFDLGSSWLLVLVKNSQIKKSFIYKIKMTGLNKKVLVWMLNWTKAVWLLKNGFIFTRWKHVLF